MPMDREDQMLKKVYEHSPVLMQHMFTSARGLLVSHARYGDVYRAHRVWLEEFDALPIEAKRSRQAASLREFVAFAATRSPFYQALYRDAGIDPSSIITVADLARLPRVDKETLRAHIGQVTVASGRSDVAAHTGGTTGKSLTVNLWREDLQRRMAVLDHFKARVGFENRRMRRASFTGKHIVPPHQKGGPYWRYNHACRQLLFSAFHLNSETASLYFEALRRFRPLAIDGFPSGMLQVARYMTGRGLSLETTPIAIFPTSETVLPEERRILESAFDAPVRNQYASSEGAPFITECGMGTLHIEMSTGVFEFAEHGEILITGFDTHGTPLIRYAIGDRATPANDYLCDCGIASDQVMEIAGRGSQFLCRVDGTRVFSANLSNLFKSAPNSIVAAQLIQERRGEVRILLVVDHDAFKPEHETQLRDEFIHKFDRETELVIEIVPSIPPLASGKVPFVRNLVPPPLDA